MFGLSGFELAIILVFGFLIFGPDKLPEIARTIGRVMKQFRSAQEQMNKVIKAEVYDPLKDLEPLANPFAGFSLDGSGDSAKKADAKKTETKKIETKKTVDKSKSDLPEDTESGTVKEELKLSSKDVQAAISEDAKETKKKALRDAAEKTEGAASSSESFAERRARLEREHTKAKEERGKAEGAGAALGAAAAIGAAAAVGATAAESTTAVKPSAASEKAAPAEKVAESKPAAPAEKAAESKPAAASEKPAEGKPAAPAEKAASKSAAAPAAKAAPKKTGAEIKPKASDERKEDEKGL